jgi:hypothetical protein
LHAGAFEGENMHQLFVSMPVQMVSPLSAGAAGVMLQEASVDPLGLLRDTKLQHSLPLASAYAALLDYPPTNEQLKRQRARLDPTNREPLFTNFNR